MCIGLKKQEKYENNQRPTIKISPFNKHKKKDELQMTHRLAKRLASICSIFIHEIEFKIRLPSWNYKKS
jgi:L-rhamnose isomerase